MAGDKISKRLINKMTAAMEALTLEVEEARAELKDVLTGQAELKEIALNIVENQALAAKVQPNPAPRRAIKK